MTIPATGLAEQRESLFEVTSDLLAIDALLTESEGEVTEEIQLWMNEYADKLAAKADGIGFYAKTLQRDAEFYKAQADELAAKRRREERKLEWLKSYVGFCLARLNVRSVKGKVYTLAIQTHGGKPPLRLLQDDPLAFPEPCRVVTVTISKDAVRAAIEMDTLPDGLAVIDPPGEGVRIR